MSERNVNVRHKQRSDVAANWADVNPILLLGEFGVESDTGMVKIGDGVQTWNNLPYIKGKKGDIVDWPAEFKPEPHKHNAADITDFPETMPPAPHNHSKSDITDFPTEMPASDVYPWAKEAEKPTYTPSEVGALALTATAADSDKLDGYHARDLMVGNPNLLHNWDFRNPVNQRGVSSGNQPSSAGYFYDRWIQGGRVYVSTNYVALDAGEYIEQRIEGIGLAGQTCTLTYLNYGSVDKKHTGVFPGTAGAYNDYTDSEVTIRFGHGTTYMYIRIIGASASAAAIRRVKLELGPVSTLHLDPPMDHAVELPKCQRFYAKATGMLQYWEHGSGTARFVGFIAFPVTMRISPTMVYGPCTINNVEANIQGLITVVSIYNKREIREVRVNKSFTGSLATPLSLEVTAMADL